LTLDILFLPETYSPILLYWKAKELRRLAGDDRYRSPLEFNKVRFIHRLRISLYRPILLFTTEPIHPCSLPLPPLHRAVRLHRRLHRRLRKSQRIRTQTHIHRVPRHRIRSSPISPNNNNCNAASPPRYPLQSNRRTQSPLSRNQIVHGHVWGAGYSHLTLLDGQDSTPVHFLLESTDCVCTLWFRDFVCVCFGVSVRR